MEPSIRAIALHTPDVYLQSKPSRTAVLQVSFNMYFSCPEAVLGLGFWCEGCKAAMCAGAADSRLLQHIYEKVKCRCSLEGLSTAAVHSEIPKTT